MSKSIVMKVLIGISFVLLSSALSAYSQNAEDVLFSDILLVKKAKVKSKGKIGPGKFLAWQSFALYKNFISPQDIQSCSFTPSCSQYAIKSIQKLGVWEGILNSFDRLARCNSLSPEHYHLHPKINLLHDPL